MTLDIELQRNHLKPPVRTHTGDEEKDYYLDIIYKLEYRAYDMLRSQERTKSGKLGNNTGNRWKRSSAEFFKSLAEQGKTWINGESSFPNPWSYKQWFKIKSILKDNLLMPYDEKLSYEKHKAVMEELRRKADAYDSLTNGNAMPDPDSLDDSYL